MPPLFALILCLLPVSAAAGRRDRDALREGATRGPSASAAEIPALASLLEKAQWEPTPELSGVFVAGRIFEATDQGHRVLAEGCILQAPLESTYTSAELVSSLQAGVAVRGGLAKGAVSGELVKKVKFGTPVQVTVPRLDLVLTEDCASRLRGLPAAALDSAYVVQEVLRAEIAEQTCGRLDASGRIVGLGEADAAYAAACAQISLEPVAVGYRTVPLRGLLPALRAPTPLPAADFDPPPRTGSAPQGVYARDAWASAPDQGCPWPGPTVVDASMAWLHVDGLSIDVRGQATRARIVSELHRCGYGQAAFAFEEWRKKRRATNLWMIYPPLGIFVSPFTASAAGRAAVELEAALRARR